jgi:hypothetical protein
MQPLLQGEAYAEYVEEYDRTKQPGLEDAVRIINCQSEIIIETLNGMKNTVRDRKQTISFLLEQCILISAALPTANHKERVLFRRIRRHTERIRRMTRGDRL